MHNVDIHEPWQRIPHNGRTGLVQSFSFRRSSRRWRPPSMIVSIMSCWVPCSMYNVTRHTNCKRLPQHAKADHATALVGWLVRPCLTKTNVWALQSYTILNLPGSTGVCPIKRGMCTLLASYRLQASANDSPNRVLKIAIGHLVPHLVYDCSKDGSML